MVFAQGFVHAQERLWQMDFTRRVVFGRLSEVLGEAALPVDRVMRTLGFYRTAEKEAEIVSPEFRSFLESYCAGVNAWMDSAINRNKLPIEFISRISPGTLAGRGFNGLGKIDVLDFGCKLAVWNGTAVYFTNIWAMQRQVNWNSISKKHGL